MTTPDRNPFRVAPAVYFGCWDRVGHGLYDAKGRGLPYNWFENLDGGYVPDQARGGGPEGVVRLTHKNGCTFLGFRDNSIDSRGGSHATFVLRGDLDYDDAMETAREWFPFVFARIEARGVTLTPEVPRV